MQNLKKAWSQKSEVKNSTFPRNNTNISKTRSKFDKLTPVFGIFLTKWLGVQFWHSMLMQ